MSDSGRRPPAKKKPSPARSSKPGPRGPARRDAASRNLRAVRPGAPRPGAARPGAAGRPASPGRTGEARPERPDVSAWAVWGPGKGSPRADLAIIGGGAAGMAAAIFAAEAAPSAKIVLLESARKPGAKILVSGGGRCNVTNEQVKPEDYCGGPPALIRNVLRAFDEQRTLAWMKSLGVDLKLEPTGKYFPVTDSASTVLAALFERLRKLRVEFRTGVKVNRLLPKDGGFEIYAGQERPEVTARRVIMATGGLALPKSGSDGAGLRWMRALGHHLVEPTPALAPLLVTAGPWGRGAPAALAGLTVEARLTLSDAPGRKLAESAGSLLFTHFGLSGPAAMNFSRHLARYRLEHPGEEGRVGLGLTHFATPEAADAWLQAQAAAHPKRQVANVLGELMPDRLADGFVVSGRAPDAVRIGDLNREQRTALARDLVAAPLRVEGDRGYAFAETTAGGVDLRDVDVRTMESRVTPGLHLCGEILDVDGRIGGFNFQWAWATGFLAGRAAARALAEAAAPETSSAGTSTKD